MSRHGYYEPELRSDVEMRLRKDLRALLEGMKPWQREMYGYLATDTVDQWQWKITLARIVIAVDVGQLDLTELYWLAQ